MGKQSRQKLAAMGADRGITKSGKPISKDSSSSSSNNNKSRKKLMEVQVTQVYNPSITVTTTADNFRALVQHLTGNGGQEAGLGVGLGAGLGLEVGECFSPPSLTSYDRRHAHAHGSCGSTHERDCMTSEIGFATPKPLPTTPSNYNQAFLDNPYPWTCILPTPPHLPSSLFDYTLY